MEATRMLDQHPAATAIQREVLESLRRQPPQLPSKYFYDAHGASLFEQICNTAEYYPTRTEISILDQFLPAIAEQLGPQRWVLEPGSGSGIKTRKLLEALKQPAGYVPIDISKQQLADYSDELQQQFPQLALRPICADFMQPLPAGTCPQRPVIWFPGSTIGNFSQQQAHAFLQRMSGWGETGTDLLIGVDLIKPVAVLEAAYNDAAGITAAFNLNLLRHLNRVADSDFDLAAYRHEARWNAALSAIQMFLLPQSPQRIHIAGECIDLERDQAICTEYSHKYVAEDFMAMAQAAGWQSRGLYRDARKWFGVFHFSLH